VDAYREAVELGLAECVRLVEGVESMRAIVGESRQIEEVAADRRG
jgi:hypothetical protein